MALGGFLRGGGVYSGSLHADGHDLEWCFQDLLRKRDLYLTEINLLYLDEGK
jgi:hypothetical protein